MRTTIALHELVEDVIKMFGMHEYFEYAKCTAVIGDPDFSWISDIAPHPRLIASVCIIACVLVVNIRLCRLSTRRGG